MDHCNIFMLWEQTGVLGALNAPGVPEGETVEAEGDGFLFLLTPCHSQPIAFLQLQAQATLLTKAQDEIQNFPPQNERFSIAENEKPLIMCSENVSIKLRVESKKISSFKKVQLEKNGSNVPPKYNGMENSARSASLSTLTV